MDGENLSGAKVGDLLFISNRWNSRGWLEPVKRVTPTGRVVTDNGEFSRDGWKRGETGYGRTYARLATDDDRAAINRHALCEKLRKFPWERVAADDLKAIGELISKVKLIPVREPS